MSQQNTRRHSLSTPFLVSDVVGPRSDVDTDSRGGGCDSHTQPSGGELQRCHSHSAASQSPAVDTAQGGPPGAECRESHFYNLTLALHQCTILFIL